jgi:hypothetical protein
MRAVPGTARMAMRFQVLMRVEGQKKPVHVNGPGLTAWRTSRVGVGRFVYTQTVNGLKPGGAYRAVVDFRWYDATGAVIHQVRRSSGSCVENGALPNPG